MFLLVGRRTGMKGTNGLNFRGSAVTGSSQERVLSWGTHTQARAQSDFRRTSCFSLILRSNEFFSVDSWGVLSILLNVRDAHHPHSISGTPAPVQDRSIAVDPEKVSAVYWTCLENGDMFLFSSWGCLSPHSWLLGSSSSSSSSSRSMETVKVCWK